jgi:tRNA-specific 2-thiouridylase
LEGRAATVVLDDGEFGVAPGQACVFYSSDSAARVLGGGWITATSANIDEAQFGAEEWRAGHQSGVQAVLAAVPGE